MSQNRKLNIQYALIQIFYWMAECSICGLPVIFFGKLGFSDAQIGIITAMESLSAVLIQSAYPAILSRFPGLTIYSLLAILYGLAIIISGAAFFLPAIFGLFLIAFALLAVTQQATATLLNAIAMDFINQGYSLNFGLTRGLGSISWAVAGIFYGKLLDHSDPRYLLLINSAGLLALLLVLFRMQSGFPLTATHTEQRESPETGISGIALLKQNPILAILCLGCCLMYLGVPAFTAGRMPNYLTRFNGTAADAGLAVFIAAGTELPMMILVDFLKHRTDVRKIMRFSVLVFMLKPFLVFFAPSKTLLILSQLSNGPSYGMFLISSVSYVNQITNNETRVAGLSYFSASESIGNTIGNLASGLLMGSAGIIGLTLYGGAASVLGGLILLLGLSKKPENARSVCFNFPC